MTVCTVVKSKVKISPNFVAFSEYMNFNLLDMRNCRKKLKKIFCSQKLFWPFTIWINCSSDLKQTRNNFSCSRSEQFWYQNTISHCVVAIRRQTMPVPFSNATPPPFITFELILYSMKFSLEVRLQFQKLLKKSAFQNFYGRSLKKWTIGVYN